MDHCVCRCVCVCVWVWVCVWVGVCVGVLRACFRAGVNAPGGGRHHNQARLPIKLGSLLVAKRESRVTDPDAHSYHHNWMPVISLRDWRLSSG